MHLRRVAICVILVLPLAAAACANSARAESPTLVAGVQVDIDEGDYTPEGLLRVQQQVLAAYPVTHHYALPLDVKAAYYEWELWRYHKTPWQQVQHYVTLPGASGQRPQWIPGSDSSTWNGALLAALSYKYAVTKDAGTLKRIDDLLHGMHLFFEVTQQPGLAARNVSTEPGTVGLGEESYEAPDGTVYYFRGDPAKGTYNQLAGGMAAMLMHVYPDLPAATQQMAHGDVVAMAIHLVDHEFRLTKRNGERTPYGNITPRVGPVGVPFNAQVAYAILAPAATFAPGDPVQRNRILHEFNKLRGKYHVYYVNPWRGLIRPQEVGGSPFVKGMNDRNHVTNAAFVGLALERHQARVQGIPVDHEFMYQLGRTMYWSMEYLEHEHNALCNVMWAGMLLSDSSVFNAMIKDRRNAYRGRVERMLERAVEQLRHFPLERFRYEGHDVPVDHFVWVDDRRLSDYQWKEPSRVRWQRTGARTNTISCSTDFLYAYWLLRYYGLDKHPAAAPHAQVLQHGLAE